MIKTSKSKTRKGVIYVNLRNPCHSKTTTALLTQINYQDGKIHLLKRKKYLNHPVLLVEPQKDLNSTERQKKNEIVNIDVRVE